jgi:hypothetical protein
MVAEPPGRGAAALDYMESQSVSEEPSEEVRVDNFAPVVFPANFVIVGRDPSRIGPLNRFSRLHMAGVMCLVCTVIIVIIVGLLALWHKL